MADCRARRFEVLGVSVDAVTTSDVVATIGRWINTKYTSFVCVTGVHGIIESLDSQIVAIAHRDAGLVVPDGRPLVWCGRMLGLSIGQVRGTDLMTEVMRKSQQAGWRHFFYGSTQSALDELSNTLATEFPNAVQVGSFAPPFRQLTDDELSGVIATIDAARPDIVWVGLSTPKQELFMRDVRGRLRAPVLIGVGAAFDFLAGRQKQAPHTTRVLGLEWLWRLITEPRRLWRRYLNIVPRFVVGIIRRPPSVLPAEGNR